jgi:hypothetical protein
LAIFFILTVSVMNAVAAGQAHTTGRTLVIDKARKSLDVFADGRRLAEYHVSFGIDPVSDKYKAFDCATPEGLYFITNKKSASRFHRSLGLSYPNLADAGRGLAFGVVSTTGYKRVREAVRTSRQPPCDTGLGCGIAIHGGGVYRDGVRDWTEGCIALDNADMDKLFAAGRVGDAVIILNSARNLFGLVRPFMHVRDVDEHGLPVCPDGACFHELELPTPLGTMRITVKEGKKYGRSIHVAVDAADAPGEALLTLTDRNADGEISVLDSVGGVMAWGLSADGAYGMIRGAVATALSRGTNPLTESGRTRDGRSP